jgi:hypothetical protein
MRVASRIPISIAPRRPPPVATAPRRAATLESFEDASDNYYLFFGLIFLVLLIFALSPGVLLTLPPGRGGIWMSGNTSTAAAFVHALLLVAVLYLI